MLFVKVVKMASSAASKNRHGGKNMITIAQKSVNDCVQTQTPTFFLRHRDKKFPISMNLRCLMRIQSRQKKSGETTVLRSHAFKLMRNSCFGKSRTVFPIRF